MALVAVRFVGPRRFRFDGADPRISKFRPYSPGYSVLGVIMLWFGWWGFNGGSTLKSETRVASIILPTNLAGAAAGIIAYFDAMWRGRGDNLHAKIIGGVLGGLVVITASCDVFGPLQAVAIGAGAGFVHNWGFDLLQLRKLDDVAGAVPVHAACGVWGTMMACIPAA